MRRSHRLRAFGAGLTLLTLAACGGKELATQWVPTDAAIVRCTTAGRYRMPPVLLDLPVPRIPTGLLVRQLDPMGLNDMGFEREQPVCVALVSPSAEAVDVARGQLDALLSMYRTTGSEVRGAIGRCACNAARDAGVVELVAPCHGEPHRPTCTTSEEQTERVRAIVEPLQEMLTSTAVPRVHWRVAGRSDRPGWIIDRLDDLLARHSGGVTVFRAGQAVPSRHNHVLIRRMLELPGASAVLRLDGGRSLLVIRELDGALVLDLLSFPQVAPGLVPLLPYIDQARADALAERLSRPTTRWSATEAAAPLDKGNFTHVSREGLARVDGLLVAAAPLAGIEDAPLRLRTPEGLEPLVDSVTLQAPFGRKGEVLTATLILSDAGQQWAQTLSSNPLGIHLDELGFPLELPEDDASSTVPELAFVGHAQPVERLILSGLVGSSSFIQRLEMQHPGAVSGSVDAWELSLPPGAVAPGGTVPPPPELRAWAERVAAHAHGLKASFDPARTRFELQLAPE